MLDMMRQFVLICALLATSILAGNPTINLGYSQYAGRTSTDGVTSWRGIRYAAPPVGSLRFAPPQDPLKTSEVQQADQDGSLCIATGPTSVPAHQSEDCLFLSVFAPSSATPSSNLPVFVFIQGGGFNANSNPNLDGSGLIKASGDNIIVVTFNYRVGPYGFLASSASGSAGPSANNGLKDQRKVLQWLQTYISKFGGNPNQVVLGGDSAGAAAIALHMTAFGGRNDGLFHGAAAESISFAPVLTNAESQYQYNYFAKAVGCKDSDPAKSLTCLRGKSTADLQAQNHNVAYKNGLQPPLYMYGPTIDGDMITDLTYNAFQKGNFISIPTLIGDATNDGTVFTPRSTSSQSDSNAFLQNQFPDLTKDQLSKIDSLYPVPTEGWWRQSSNAYGEMRYMCPGLYVSSAVANTTSSSAKKTSRSPRSGDGSIFHMLERRKKRIGILLSGTSSSSHSSSPKIGSTGSSGSSSPSSQSTSSAKSWTFRYNVEDSDQLAKGLGVPHTTELNAIFGPSYVPAGTAPASYSPGGSNAAVLPVIQAYWTSFIRALDPNTHRAQGAAEWGQYYASDNTPQRLLFKTGGATEMEKVDSELRARCAYLESIGPSIKQKRELEEGVS